MSAFTRFLFRISLVYVGAWIVGPSLVQASPVAVQLCEHQLSTVTLFSQLVGKTITLETTTDGSVTGEYVGWTQGTDGRVSLLIKVQGKPVPKAYEHSDIRSASVPQLFTLTPESADRSNFSRDPALRAAHNEKIAIYNQLRFFNVELPMFETRKSAQALPDIFRIFAREHLFEVDSSNDNIDFQRELRGKVMRTKSKLPVALMNLIPPHPEDVAAVLEVFYAKLDEMIEQVVTDRDVLAVGLWARKMITFIQPGIDLNTRSARAMVAYVAVRAGYLNHMTFPVFDLADPEIRDAQIGKSQPFNDGYKDFLNDWAVHGLQTFAEANKRPYFYFYGEGELIPASATPVLATPQSVAEIMNGQHKAEWDTIRDFAISTLKNGNLHGLIQLNPELKAQIDWLLKHRH